MSDDVPASIEVRCAKIRVKGVRGWKQSPYLLGLYVPGASYLEVPAHDFCTTIVDSRAYAVKFALDMLRMLDMRGPKFSKDLSPSNDANLGSWEMQGLFKLEVTHFIPMYRVFVLLQSEHLAAATVYTMVYRANLTTIKELETELAPAEARLDEEGWSGSSAMVANVLGNLGGVGGGHHGHPDDVPVD